MSDSSEVSFRTDGRTWSRPNADPSATDNPPRPASKPAAWRALTIHQPWASLIALGHKRIETRPRRISWRGPLMIHASKTYDGPDGDLRLHDVTIDAILRSEKIDPLTLPRGAVVAVATLIDVQTTTDLLFDDSAIQTPAHEIALGDYSPGRYGWILADVEPLDYPVVARGKQGLWIPDRVCIDAVQRQLTRRLP